MSSKGKNFRRRAEEDEDINGEDSNTQSHPNGTKAKKPPPQQQQQQPQRNRHNHQAPKLLSFAADEEDDENDSPTTATVHRRRDRDRSHSRPSKPSSSGFPPSSSHQHKITSSKDRRPLSSTAGSTPSNVQPQAGEYTTEKLRELQKNTRTLASSKPSSATKSLEPVVVLKGLLKPTSPPTPPLTLEDEEVAASEEVVLDHRRRNLERDKDDAESRLATMGLGKSTKDSLIPDQATINAIRAKRERLRQSRAPDYISLDGGTNQQGLSDDEPEFEGRIALLGEKTDGATKGIFESFDSGRMAAEARTRVDDEDEEDEEDKIWEEEQFRKGLGKRMDDGSNRGGHSIPAVQPLQPQPSVVYPGNVYQMASHVSSTGTVGVSRSAEVMSISQQAEVATRALQESVRRLKETHGRTMSSIARTDESLSASLLNITALEKSLSAAGEKFVFMQKLRDFVSVICAFLQDKAPYIEELEEQMQKLHEERASAIVERRAADIADEMTEVEAAVNAAMPIFSKGGGTTAVAAAATAAQAASLAAREQSNLPVQLDEFGRDVNQQKRMDLIRRSEARKRRRARSESKRLSSTGDDSAYRVEGESSTDESESESSSYQSNRDVLLQTAEQVFSDAADEYSELSIVKERLEKWKKYYSSSYRDAYMSLSAPAIFSPYVRLELLKWDPLYEAADFNDMQWHSLLFNYGLPEDGSDFNLDDADANLIPELVEKVALPILHHEIAHCWDMLSTRGTKNAVSATKLVISYIPASSEALQELLAAVRNRLADAVDNLSVPTWNSLVMKVVPNAGRTAAYRFGMSVRLLKNICYWKDILALPILEQLVLDELLSGKVLPHIRSVTPNIHDAITRTERVIASLSGVWSGPSVTGGHSQKLQPLVEHIATLGKTLEKRHASGANSDTEISGLARRLKKMLVELNEYDKARAVLRTFQLKEAL
ncbi:transcriptional repressor ILP1 [Magnolia sinica]|uniref:transcriptional repressor ILP1 n=1 Tax=Magnolia sinica TaxID=86752 RepID=UPI00265AED92|nr:transcriptional repressor ILP1 [Magnolia sinica]XP_058109229.1 transcriptional repressor ILP1 [Magnolia sinica]XP_058109237.1 transcriptional repressor ILP1 [Magnolia sinica]XP_058109246.1 transcriptional repressor ILP1 [Magnolia sinica]XP_058109250.1 transcriptional repressor ILP1 [Magnolia sinica]